MFQSYEETVEVACDVGTAIQREPFQFQAFPVPAEDVGLAGVIGTFALNVPEYQFIGVKLLL